MKSSALILLVLGLLTGLLAGCQVGKQASVPPLEPEDPPLRVVVSIPPLADWVRELAGPEAEVTCLLPPGASPHTFEPTPQQVTDLSKADIFVMIGLGLEEWAGKLVEALSKSDVRIIKLGDALAADHPLRKSEFLANPHVWLGPDFASELVLRLSYGLENEDPLHINQYKEHREMYLKQLQVMKTQLTALLEPYRGAPVISFHNAFSYFYEQLGLKEAGLIEEHAGVEPAASHLAELVQQAKAAQVRVVIAEPQLSDQAAQVIAKETGAKVVKLDPLGGAGGERTSYIELQLANGRALAEALGSGY